MLELVIANMPLPSGGWAVIAVSDFKMILLLTGLIVLTGGLWSVWQHREQFGQLQQQLEPKSLTFKFEHRKHVRRSIVGGLMAGCGIVLAGFYWVHEGRAFAILLAMLLLLIVGITILAVMDMLSISLRRGIKQLAETDTETDRAIAAAIAKHHSENSNASNDETNQS